MEKQVIFRDYQEQQAQDHNDLQDFSRQALQHIVQDAVTDARRFAGFNVVKTAQTEVQVQPGRFYDVGGAVYGRASILTQSLVTHLAAAAKRIVSVSVYGTENETEVEERDFLVNVETGLTEPDAVATVRSRDAVLVFTAGAEGADPQPPAIPATHVEIARILLDPIQVVSVTMMEENMVASTKELDSRTDALEFFKRQIEPRVASLASDLAELANRVNKQGRTAELVTLFEDVGRLKDMQGLPDNYTNYGADGFLVPDESDADNSAGLGYDALTEMGIRFPPANADQFEMRMFSANDPNAALSNGFLLPKYTSELKISTGEFATDLGIGQYGFQSYDLVQKTIRKERLRYGGQYYVCSNGARAWKEGEQAPFWLPDFETYQTVHVTDNAHLGFGAAYYDYWWHDSWTETYWELETIEHAIVGAQVAQSFLVSNDMWATRIGFYVTQKAANENIFVTICEVSNGVPDLKKVIAHQAYPHASIVVGWNRAEIVPTFLQKGKRYAIVLTSNANHKIGMAEGNSYLDGTFFYSTDSEYYLGDLTKDMMLEVWGARFAASQVTIEMEPINLDGGFRNIDITASCVAPESTQLVYEVRPSGTGEWLPLTRDMTDILNAAPPLCQFRLRFVGTKDMMPGIKLTGSRVYVSRPKLAFRHISTPIILAAASDEITVKVTAEGFESVPHDFDCRLRVGDAWETADVVSTKLLAIERKRYQRIFTFNLSEPVSTFRIEITGTTNTPANTFHIAERLHYAVA